MGYNQYGRDHFDPVNDNITPEDTDATPTLTDFYFTFGTNHSADPNGWVRISAPSILDARTAMFQIHGRKWSFCYELLELKVNYFPAGELAHFRFNPNQDTAPWLIETNGSYIPPKDAMFFT